MNDNNDTDVEQLKETLEHNVSYQKTIKSNIHTLTKILIENSEKQRLLKTKISKYDLKKFIGTVRGPKRFDFYEIPHWMFDTMDEETGTIAPMENNIDTKIYAQKLQDFKIDHTLLKFSSTEQRQLSKAIANCIRLLYLKDLHNKWRKDTRKLQDELNKIRIKDSKNELWPLNHWKEYPIPWRRIATDHMQGRTASECKVFWNGHTCLDNPSINRNKTWNKKENEKLLEIASKHNAKDWISIANEHNYNRTPLQCASQWMRKVKPRAKVDRKWTKQEDELLKELVFKHGKNNFLYIGSHFQNRTALQCSSRWLKSTAPYIRSGEWDIVEDIQCVLSHNAYLPKRTPIIHNNNNNNNNNTDNDIIIMDDTSPLNIIETDRNENGNKKKGKKSKKKNKSKSQKKKTSKKKKDSKNKNKKADKPEIIVLSEQKSNNNKVVNKRSGKHGVWVLIGRHVTYRNDVKARERYMNVLNPDIDIESQWTKKEDNDLLQYHQEHGDKWSLIARKLGTNRTDCYCRQRYKALMKKNKRKKKNKNKNVQIDLTVTKKNKNKNKKKNKASNVEKQSKKKQNNNNKIRSKTTRKRKRRSYDYGEDYGEDCDSDEYYPIDIEPKKKKRKKSKKKNKKKNKRKTIKVKCTQTEEKKKEIENNINVNINTALPMSNNGITTRSKSRLRQQNQNKNNLNKNQNINTQQKQPFIPKYLMTPFPENRPFVGASPNRFILNQPKNENKQRYIIPLVPSINNNNNNNNGFRMLSTDKNNNNNRIDTFIQNNKNNNQTFDDGRLLIPLPFTNNSIPPLPIINNPITFPSLSGQLPINFMPINSNSNRNINTKSSQYNKQMFISMPRFQPIPMLNPFQSAANSVINENIFKISFPLNNYNNKSNHIISISAPPQQPNLMCKPLPIPPIPQLIPILNNKDKERKGENMNVNDGLQTNVEHIIRN